MQREPQLVQVKPARGSISIGRIDLNPRDWLQEPVAKGAAGQYQPE
jgi:hypothetical protein